MPATSVHTYILAGDDWDNAMGDFRTEMAKRPDVTILSASKYASIQEAARTIKPPANVVIACHGDGDGTVVWRDNAQYPTYADVFRALPEKDIGLISMICCKGGSAVGYGYGQFLPKGAILQPLVEGVAYNFGAGIKAIEKISGASAVPVMIGSMGAIVPENFARLQNDYDKMPPPSYGYGIKANNIATPGFVIGGEPPRTILYEPLLQSMMKEGHDGRLKDLPAYRAAVEMVHRYYNVSGANPSGGADDINQNIDRVANQIARGEMPNSPRDTQIANALTLAQLETTHTLSYFIARGRNLELPTLDGGAFNPLQPSRIEGFLRANGARDSEGHLVRRDGDLASAMQSLNLFFRTPHNGPLKGYEYFADSIDASDMPTFVQALHKMADAMKDYPINRSQKSHVNEKELNEADREVSRLVSHHLHQPKLGNNR